jgi:Zn-dependent protease/CBS domain-containing protein
MKGSWRIARLFGVDIFVHWTFAILLAFVAFMNVRDGGWTAAGYGVLLVSAIFVCVVLHELGHALAAKRYGIGTQDITLLPIGGLARLEHMPEEPKQELVVALAGPAVNVVIVVALVISLWILGGLSSADLIENPENVLLFKLRTGLEHFLLSLAGANVLLVLFNLIPAFPMDGGRVLRALLAMRMSYPQATRIAATIGQGIAILFAIAGLFWWSQPNWLLLLIALFVFIAAQAEAQMVQTRAMFQGVTVREAMVSRYRTLSPESPLAEAVQLLLEGHQEDFPVVDQGRVVGLLSRTDLVKALSQSDPQRPVRESLRNECAVAQEDEPLDKAFTRMQHGQCSTLPVVRNGELIGLLTLENIGEWVMIKSAMSRPT